MKRAMTIVLAGLFAAVSAGHAEATRLRLKSTSVSALQLRPDKSSRQAGEFVFKTVGKRE